MVMSWMLAIAGCSGMLGYQSPEAERTLPAELVPKGPPPTEVRVTIEPERSSEGRVVGLREVLDRASESSAAVLTAEARLQAAAGRTQQADGELMPGLEAGGGARILHGAEQNNFGAIQDVSFWRFDPSVALVYRANIGAGVKRSVAARREQDASQRDVEEAQRNAMLAAAFAYHDLALGRASMDIANRLAADADQFLVIARARAESGIASEADVALAESELANARTLRFEAEAQWETTSATLSTLMRWDPSERLVPADRDVAPWNAVVLDDEKTLVAEVASRPDVRAAEHRAEAARQRRKSVRWDIFAPDFVFGIQERLLGSDTVAPGPGTIGQAYLGWTFSLADIGRAKAAKGEAKAREIEHEWAREQAAGQVAKARARARAARSSIAEAKNRLEAAERNHRIQLARFEAGTALGLEVIQAQNGVARARFGVADTVLRYNAHQLEVLAAVGHLRPDRVPRAARRDARE